MYPQDHPCFERVHNAVETLCGPGTLHDRLKDAANILIALLMEDFPTEEQRQGYADAMWHLTREDPAGQRGSIGTTMDALTEEEQQTAVRKILALYASVLTNA